MLTAICNSLRADAASSERGFRYTCPKCKNDLDLKKGRIRVHHFAHKPPTDCSWSSGETQAHLAAKIVLRDAYRLRNYTADYEVEILSSGGDRRADVLITSPNGRRVAIEVQHQPILYDAIERRTQAYIAANIPIMWIGILSEKMHDNAEMTPSGLLIRQYSIRPWEKWVHALCFKEIWYINPFQRTLWKGVFSNHLIDVPSTSWYSQDGDEEFAGGYTRISKKWRTLHLEGPFDLQSIDIKIKRRDAWASTVFSLPAGHFAQFSV